MIVLLDGRSFHQSLTLSTEDAKITWVCDSSAPIVGPMECHQGGRSFRIEQG
jgi:hypothetical protein